MQFLKNFLIVLLALFVITSGCARKPSLIMGDYFIIVKNGTPQCSIVIPENCIPSVKYASEELQKFIKEMSGAEIPIITDASPIQGKEIILGKSKRLENIDYKIDWENLGEEGYNLLVTKDNIIIAGGEPRGTLYGVYGVLDDHLGCRWFTPTVSRIPKMDTIALPALNEIFIPPLEYREPFTMDGFIDGDWCARNRANGNTCRLEEKHGGKIIYYGFVHTFDALVPPEKYFDTHPEYFSMVDGKRIKERTQLCCTNEEVIQLVIEEVKKWMREHPEAKVFSVSQNDWYNFCQCPKCSALATAEDSQMGPLLYLVNSVARAVRDEFPDKVIDTLAYQWSRKPPKTMRPEPNVIIRLCSIECCFAHPFESCVSKQNRDFVKDVEGWSQICNRLWVWDYVTSFSHYLVPFPNLEVRAPNIRFFVKHNVTGIFEQDTYTTLHGEFNELSAYLNAKLLWDPAYDDKLAISEFVDAFYEDAGPYIMEYLKLIHKPTQKREIHMNIWVGPNGRHITPDMLKQAEIIFDKAENAVADKPEVLERVKVARLSIDYTIMERARKRDTDLKMKNDDPTMITRAKRFFEIAERNNVTQYRESNGSIADYKKIIEEWLGTTL